MMAMETSSPLAAMQPPSLGALWGRGHQDRSSLDATFLRPPPFRPREFDFNKMSMHKPSEDYFTFRPVRGSSPTQSLAVDLSQNFHIDKSPQLPTPRRSLFTSTFLDVERKQNVVTPPIPSSSPGPDHDLMETSPLPHKQPQTLVEQRVLCSPILEPYPVVEEPSAMPYLRRSESQPSNPLNAHERKTSNPIRPSIRRGYSHTGQLNSFRPASAQPPQAPFWFGPRCSAANKPSLETFMESPPSERKLAPSQSNPALVGSPVGFLPSLTNGSPVANARRPSIGRPRLGMGRRTQSMQCNEPCRPTRAEKRCCTTGAIQASTPLPEQPQLKLPHFKPSDEVDGLPRISMETLVKVLEGEYKTDLGETAIIDCRFEYEFQGGHIEGAMNFNDKDQIANKLFDSRSAGNKTLIFHCEYSAHRAPLMAKFVRQRDRIMNQDKYPHLTYPDIYILDGGYHKFFRNHASRCFPQNYVEMDAKEHENACERGMARVKRRNKLSRAQTYAFGQSSSRQIDMNLPTISRETENLGCHTTVAEVMDVDFSSPVEMTWPLSTAPANKSLCSFASPSTASRSSIKRLGSY